MTRSDPASFQEPAADAGSMGGRSTQTYLLALSLALVLPVALVSLWLAIGLQQSDEQRFRQSGHEAVRQSALAIELDLRGLTTTIELLAASPALAAGDLAAFRNEAMAAAAIERVAVVLRDVSSKLLVNTSVPAGSPPGDVTRLAEIDRQVLGSGRSATSNFFRSVIDNRPLVAIVVPVRRDGAIVYLLSAAFDVERLRQILRTHSAGHWRTGIIGSDGVVITRLREPDIHGARPPVVAAAAARAEQGYFEMIATDNDPSAVAFQRAGNGWTVIAVASIGAFRKDQLTRISIALGTSLGLAALGIGGALWLGRRISGPMRALEAAAGQLSEGREVTFAPGANAEANRVGGALSEASLALRARERELVASHARHKNLFEAIEEAVSVVELIRDVGGRVVDYRYLDVNPAFLDGVGTENVRGRTRRDVYPQDEPTWLDVFDRVATTGESAHFEFEMKSTGRWYLAHATRLPHASDQLAVIKDDITERKRAEATRELLINELNHRVKNTLTAVQSLAMQSFKPPFSLEAGRRAFNDRLMALSRAHNVLTRQNWDSADLGEIAAESVRPFDQVEDGRVRVEGPEVKLTPKAALALSMVVHELATNAIKHGALSVESGRVDFTWTVADGRLTLVWRESGGPPAAPGGRRGFGTTLIERSLDGELGGSAEMEFSPAGLACTLTMPIGNAAAGDPRLERSAFLPDARQRAGAARPAGA